MKSGLRNQMLFLREKRQWMRRQRCQTRYRRALALPLRAKVRRQGVAEAAAEIQALAVGMAVGARGNSRQTVRRRRLRCPMSTPN